MKKISVSLEAKHVERIEDIANREDIGSRSGAVREIIDEYESLTTRCGELGTECENLRNRLESREDRIDELEEQLARRSQVEEKVDLLASRVDEADNPDPPWPVRWYQWVRE